MLIVFKRCGLAVVSSEILLWPNEPLGRPAACGSCSFGSKGGQVSLVLIQQLISGTIMTTAPLVTVIVS